MACLINAGRVLGCNTVAGVEKIWVANYDSATTATFGTANIISGLTDAPDNFYLLEQDVEFGGLTQTGVYSNNSVSFESSVTMKFIDLDAALIQLVDQLSKAKIVAIIKSNSGKYFFAGLEFPGRASAGDLSLGTAMSDLNGANLTIMFKSKNGVYEIEDTLALGLV
jgi:hypothetical protein